MADGQVGIVRAILRFFVMWNWRKARGIMEAADAQFTKDEKGLGYGYDISKDKKIEQAKAFRSSLARLASSIADTNAELKSLEQEEAQLLKQRNGALTAAERAKAKDDDKEFREAKDAFERYSTRIRDIDERQSQLEAEYKNDEAQLQSLERDVMKLEDEIRNLDKEKARAISDFLKFNAKIDLRQELAGLKTATESSPVDRIREKLKQLRAEAEVSDRLAGVDVDRSDDKYARLGESEASQSEFDSMLAARAAEKAAKTGVESPTPTKERQDL